MTKRSFFFALIILATLFTCKSALAATLRLSPETGVYTAGGTFTAQVLINTQGKPVNAADAQLSYNPKELSVVSISRGSSIFNLWTQEPTYSSGAGTISFGGGSPSGYTGASGNVMTVTFRALAAGNPKVTFKSGSILAADGMGTNVLTSMTGGNYTVSAKAETPEPEYIAPANTPTAPKVTSSTHPDQALWYKETTAKLSWSLPSDVVAVRTLLDDSPATIPTIVYDERITSREIDDLKQGVSYFHIQLKNKDGWGKVSHYRLAVDSEEPSEFTISESSADATNPERTLLFTVKDISPIATYKIQIDGGEQIVRTGAEATSTYKLPRLDSGHHTVVVEAIDSAGNSRIASYAFDISSFEKPTFTEYPTELNSDVIPAIKGTTRPDAKVVVTVSDTNGTVTTYETKSDASGTFIFIPDQAFKLGVYDITARTTDAYGAQSDESDAIRIVVSEPGYMKIGSFVVRILSIIVPLIALLFMLVVGTWYSYHRFAVWRKKLRRESTEAEERLRIEFDEIITNMHAKVEELKTARKGKLTIAEQSLIEQLELDIADARIKIAKEIQDIENIVQ